jgi:hypothetical protein
MTLSPPKAPLPLSRTLIFSDDEMQAFLEQYAKENAPDQFAVEDASLVRGAEGLAFRIRYKGVGFIKIQEIRLTLADIIKLFTAALHTEGYTVTDAYPDNTELWRREDRFFPGLVFETTSSRC